MDDYKSENSSDIYSQFALKFPQSVAKYVIKKLKKLNKDNENDLFDLMVDAGCGTGESSKPFLKYFRSLVGYDNSEFQIDKAKKLWGDGDTKMTFHVADEYNIPTPDKSVDLVICHDVVHYMNFETFMKECKRVLKSSGLIALSGADYTQLWAKKAEDCEIPFVSATNVLEKYYLSPTRQYQIDIDHPASQWALRYSDLYESVVGFNKHRGKDIDTELAVTLGDMKNIMFRVPLNRRFHATFEPDKAPLDVFGEKLKQLVDNPDAKDEAIQLRLTVSIFSIFLNF
uniref:uncharacterized protein LOC120347786 n=1 Tax=Styela clava TaxID=7725 RepID=UPI001939778D|nr:uncharacterized protein LOC120347786 [Styela clava]